MNTGNIKIAFVIDKLNTGGTENQLVKLIEHLDREKFHLSLICLRESDRIAEFHLPCERILLDVPKLCSINGVRKLIWLARFFKKKQIDIVQTFFIDGNIFGIIAGKLGGVPQIVSSRRDLGFWYNKKLLYILRLIDKCVDRYLVNSKSVKRTMIKFEGVKPEKIDIIYNGVDLEPFKGINQELREETRKKLGVYSDEIVVGIIANMNRTVKRVDLFIKAAAEVHKYHKDVSFIVVGEGELKAGLIALANELNIHGKTKFVGLQTDIIPYLSIFDVAILCSDSEGFPNALLEYMAAGVPAVSTRVGGNTELLGQDGAGIIVPPGDHQALAEATRNLIRDKQLRNTIREQALYRVNSNFSLQSMLKNTELFYLNLFTEFQRSG